MSVIQVRRVPHLDEPAWEAWWFKDASGETIEWRYGKSLRVSMCKAGVHIVGEALFTDEESRETFARIIRIAQHGVAVMKDRYERGAFKSVTYEDFTRASAN